VGAELKRILARLALESGWGGEAKLAPFDALNSVLIDMLHDYLEQQRPEPGGHWWDEPDFDAAADITGPEAARLNRAVHLVSGGALTDTRPTERGAIVVIPDDSLLSELFGSTKESVLASFKLDEEQFATRGGSLIMIQIQPQCDYAQQSGGPRPYAFGLELKHSGSWTKNKARKLPVWLSPRYAGTDDVRQICIHHRYQVVLLDERVADWSVRYRMRQQLLSELTHAMNNHRTRPGILYFGDR